MRIGQAAPGGEKESHGSQVRFAGGHQTDSVQAHTMGNFTSNDSTMLGKCPLRISVAIAKKSVHNPPPGYYHAPDGPPKMPAANSASEDEFDLQSLEHRRRRCLQDYLQKPAADSLAETSGAGMLTSQEDRTGNETSHHRQPDVTFLEFEAQGKCNLIGTYI